MHIDHQSLWFDELHSIIPTDPNNSFSSVIQYAKSDQPPLFFVMLYGWFKIFPYTEASGKIFCAIIGIFGILAMYFLGKEFSGIKAGLVAAFITSINLFHIYYSQELRFYSLLFLATAMSFICFLRFIKKNTPLHQALFILSSCILLYTHYFGMVVVLSQAIIFIGITLVYRKGMSFFLKGGVCAIICLILFIPWLPTVFADNTVSTFWIQDPGPFFFAQYFNWYFNGWWGLSFKPVLVITALIPILVFVLFLFRDIKIKHNTESIMSQGIIVGWIFFTLLIPYVYSVVKIPMIIDRYTMITLPAILLMISVGWTRIGNAYVKVVLALLFIVLTWRADHRYFSRYLKPQYRELSSEIIRQNTEDLPVLSSWAWQFNYYFRKYNADYKVISPDDRELQDLLSTASGFWVIFPQDYLSEMRLRLIDLHFNKTKDLEFHGINASMFERKQSSIRQTESNQ